MTTEIENLIAKTQNRDGLGRLFDHFAERLDEIRADLFQNRKKEAMVEDGGAHDR